MYVRMYVGAGGNSRMSITLSFPVAKELDRTLTFESFRQRRSNEEERAHRAKLDALQVWVGFVCRV